jgi:NAD(P)-dependent dehydrogenase (short-subunit alcohol dehydrogenase family)
VTRVALVAGGVSDTGLAVGLELAGLGFDVALVTADVDAASAAVERIEAAGASGAAGAAPTGRRCLAIGADLADAGSVGAALDVAKSALGSPSVLLNCVPLGSPEPLSAAERYAEARRSLRALFVCCRAVSAHMVRRRWGRIVNVAQPVGDEAVDRRWRDGQTVLGGLTGFTRSAALELAAFGITANYIAPSACHPGGPTLAPAPMPGSPARGSSPLDDAPSYSAAVASLTGFLISDQAVAITGQGGYLAGWPATSLASLE